MNFAGEYREIGILDIDLQVILDGLQGRISGGFLGVVFFYIDCLTKELIPLVLF